MSHADGQGVIKESVDTNFAELKRELTAILLKYRLLSIRGNVGQVVIHINDSAVSGIQKNNWRVV